MLKEISQHKEIQRLELVRNVTVQLNLSTEDQEDRIPSGQKTKIHSAIGWAKVSLKQENLIAYPRRGWITITEAGKKSLLSNQPFSNKSENKSEIIGKKNLYPDEIKEKDFLEGAALKVIVNAYERNREARRKCIKHWGVNGNVCGMNFQNVYGERGKGFIHVHHLNPISASEGSRRVNPVEDLRPVCPNCHAMLHQVIPPLTIESLQKQIRKAKLK